MSFVTPKSEIEEGMEKILSKAKTYILDMPLTIKGANLIISQGFKLLDKVEEIRKSRDKWRAKYEELKQKSPR